METRIKERLTGALILVALFVILVPELLSGGSQRATGDAVPEARPATEGPPLVTYRMPLEGGAESAEGQGALNALPSQQSDRLPPPVSKALPQDSAHAELTPAGTPPAAAPPPAAAASTPAPSPSPEPAPAVAAKQEPKAEARPAPKDKPVNAEKPVKADKPAKADKPDKAVDKGWYVQLGVFSKHENAEQLVKQVGKKGQTAHISGSGTAFRVRVGPLSDRIAAQAARKRLAAEGFSGTLVPPP